MLRRSIKNLPYGELLVDEHSSSEDLPYKFNGKELDEETGLYYYGARYMQPVASIWYGVDPLTEEYAEISGYVYCHANPVILFDPDGERGILHSIKGYFKGVQNSFSNTVDMVKHPVKTAKAIKYAVLHPRQTAVSIYNTAQSRYNEFINSDDGYRRGEISGETIADVAQICVGATGKKTVRLAETTNNTVTKLSNKFITWRMRKHVTNAAKEIDSKGLKALTLKQAAAVNKNSNLYPAFRGNRIDVKARQKIGNDIF